MNRTVKEIVKKLVGIIPTKPWISFSFKLYTGEKMDWKNPKTFNQKLQWLKLYNRRPEYTTMVDKYEVKKYVADRIGEEYIIPTLGVWDRFEDIDFDTLPEQFVLKCTHDSGGLIIVRDKSKLDMEAARKMFRMALGRNHYSVNREWPYKNVKPRIIAETYLGEDLRDYRFYCFNGDPKLIYSYANESNAEGDKPEPAVCDVLNEKWERMPFRQKSPPGQHIPPMPAHYEDMIRISKILARDIPFVRVDFYDTDRLYIGELTFFPGSGMSRFYPNEWDRELGDWIELPKKQK